jgi:hypothetical protein
LAYRVVFRLAYRVVFRLAYRVATVRCTISSIFPSDNSTTTVQCPLSSTGPSLAPSHSTTTIDGELILLFRLAYRVEGMYQVSALSSIVLLLQLGLINTIAIMQLVVLYQDYQGKYKTIRPFHGEWILLFRLAYRSAYRVNRMYQVSVLSSIVLLLQSGLILLFQSAYRVDGMYRAYTVLSSIVLLLQSGSVHY